MPFDRLEQVLARDLESLEKEGTRKGAESVIVRVLPTEGDRGPRVLLEGEGDRPFLRMNSNGYLGMALHPDVIAAEQEAVHEFGTGPQAVRFISGTFAPLVELEARLADFHGREATTIYSSAYAAVMGTLPALINDATLVISDELNHNCIVNAIRLGQPAKKRVFPHLDMDALEAALEQGVGRYQRAIIVTDGIFSMRGDHAPLDRIVAIARDYDDRFEENVCVVVDDSHGIGALGETGRGTEEATATRADLLIATLGKALGVNGGYVVGSRTLIDFLREKSPYYVYSNPITPAEAAAASRALELLDSKEGRNRLEQLRLLTRRLRAGLEKLGFESIPGEHPVVPLLVRDTARTTELVQHLRAHAVLATGLAYPVVPKGEDEIRFQVSADHTPTDIDELLAALGSF